MAISCVADFPKANIWRIPICAALSSGIPRMRADIKFLAGIIKRPRPPAPYLSDRRREPLGAATERRRWKALSMGSVI
jgi:hypothetical protein